MAHQNRKAQLLTLLYSMKTQGKESATFNIDWLIQAVQQPDEQIAEQFVPRETIDPYDNDEYARSHDGEMDGGEF